MNVRWKHMLVQIISLEFKMLKKFVYHSAFVVRHLLQCYLIESDFAAMCRKYDVSFTMPINAIKNALTEHFWSAVGLLVS